MRFLQCRLQALLLAALVLVSSLSLSACSKKREVPVEDERPGPRPSGKLIVVLGSSTSAGTGPSQPANAWVARYRTYLADRFPAFQVVNLAVGGQTTYEVQPTGFVSPPGRPRPKAGKNITAALALAPSALILNLPSNDAAVGISVAEQLANFERVATLAESARVPLWVSTTQPRNFGDAGQRAAQIAAKDALKVRFGARCLDFWTPFATPERTLKREYDAGDGTHLNDRAHAILLALVIDAAIPESVQSATP